MKPHDQGKRAGRLLLNLDILGRGNKTPEYFKSMVIRVKTIDPFIITLLLDMAVAFVISISFFPWGVKFCSFYFTKFTCCTVSENPRGWQFGGLISSRQKLESGACPHPWVCTTEKLCNLGTHRSLCLSFSTSSSQDACASSLVPDKNVLGFNLALNPSPWQIIFAET